jgi:copper transporter 1
MDHGNMGHGGMDHGGMDHGNMCNMNVSLSSTAPLCPHLSKTYKQQETDDNETDALHMGHTKPLHRLQILARHLHHVTPLVPTRRHAIIIREISRRYEAKVQREIDDMPSKFLLASPTSFQLSAVYTSALLCFVAKIEESTLLKWA